MRATSLTSKSKASGGGGLTAAMLADGVPLNVSQQANKFQGYGDAVEQRAFVVRDFAKEERDGTSVGAQNKMS